FSSPNLKMWHMHACSDFRFYRLGDHVKNLLQKKKSHSRLGGVGGVARERTQQGRGHQVAQVGLM
ncbi:hypothetical protein BL173_00013095, partial [Klebsiella pneumoniae]|uniref:hypothetical protein n=1 Tax=Klebsiella pneumoniae TaxID=573 RepID=UPI0009D5C2B4